VSDLSLTYAGYLYLDRTRALQTGQVKPAGIDLRVQVVEIGELFRRMAQHCEFDVAEMSMSTYLMMLGQGDTRLIGIPVFLSRAFRHSMVFVNSHAGIDKPEDLKGKNVGIPEYQMTAAVWVRAFLEHDYGVKPSDIKWWYGGIESPGYTERRHHDSPAGVHLEQIPDDKALTPMLDSGELDAFVTAANPKPFRERSPNVRRLFTDYQEVERDYFRRTGFFPIMHLVCIRRELYEANGWIAAALLDAFIESKRLGMERLRQTGALPVAIPWLGADIEQLDELFGGDAFAYGFGQNRKTLEALAGYSHEQGLTPRRFTPEELFAPETHDHPGDSLGSWNPKLR
jgi:4,5-dihydroxyphthalate decarboxylase